MKRRINPFIRHSAALAAFALTASTAFAATVQWVGDTDANFANGTNWATDPALPSLSADTWQINTLGSFGSTLTVDSDTLTAGNQGLSFTGTSGKISFGASAPAMTLTGGDLSFFKGTGDTILLGTGSTVTQTVQNNLILGDGSATTMSVTNQSITGGLLKITGNITAGTGGTPGATILSFGSTGTNNGNYEVSGNITKGATATTMAITKRGSGSLTLTGTNEVVSLAQNESGSSIIIDGGKTSILQTGVQANWGGNRVDSSVKITGGELYANDASGLRSRVEIDGGTLTIGTATNASGIYWDVQGTAPGEVFTLKSGKVNFDSALTSGYLRGFRLQANSVSQTISGTQSGGNFSVVGGSAAGNVFTVGINTAAYSATTNYTLSGGVLDLKGQNGTSQGHLQINADAGGTSTSTFTLSGTGKLISRFNPGSAGGIAGGANVDAKQILALTGGTLVAGRIDATNLRSSLAGTNGTLVNNGTNIAPGDIGTIGRTSITGAVEIDSGTLTIDLSGLAASTVFSEAANSGNFDNLLISGNLSLGGNLGLNLVNGYVPGFNDIFKIIDIGGTLNNPLLNFFDNVADGATLATLGNEGTFKVYSEGNDVFLSNFTAVPEPRAALLGVLGMIALLRRRRD